MKITVEGNIFEVTPEEIKEMMTLMGAEFPESAKEVKPTPKFKVGDRARLKTDRGALAGFTAGDVVEIRALGRDSVNDVEVYGRSHGTTGYTTSENLEELTNEFRVGDRVKALDDGEFGDVIEGEIGTIDSIFEGDDDPYNIKVKTADDYCDYLRPQDLELIAEEAVQFAKIGRKPGEFKKGDIVRFNEDTGARRYPEGSFAEITSEVIGSSFSFGDGYAGDTEWVELIAPVESRVDVE